MKQDTQSRWAGKTQRNGVGRAVGGGFRIGEHICTHDWFMSMYGKFSSVIHLCPTLWDPMDCSKPASLFITNSQSLLKLMSIESGMPSNHLILCHALLLLPSIFPSIRVFSNKSVLCIRWPKYWSFSFSISPSNEYSGLTSFKDWLVWSPCNPRDSQESSANTGEFVIMGENTKI